MELKVSRMQIQHVVSSLGSTRIHYINPPEFKRIHHWDPQVSITGSHQSDLLGYTNRSSNWTQHVDQPRVTTWIKPDQPGSATLIQKDTLHGSTRINHMDPTHGSTRIHQQDPQGSTKWVYQYPPVGFTRIHNMDPQ